MTSHDVASVTCPALVVGLSGSRSSGGTKNKCTSPTGTNPPGAFSATAAGPVLRPKVRRCSLKPFHNRSTTVPQPFHKVEPRVGSVWSQRLKLKCERLLSSLAFSFNLRHYAKSGVNGPVGAKTAPMGLKPQQVGWCRLTPG